MKADDDTLGLLLMGGGVAAASALAWRTWRPNPNEGTTVTSSSAVTNDAIWIQPVPIFDERSAVVSNEFRAQRSVDGKSTQHLGVDLMYRRRDARDLIAAFPPGTPAGTQWFFMPADVSALAAAAGVVTFAATTPVRNTVVILHPNGWATYYTHLATLAVARGTRVNAGQPIGTIGASPEDAAHLRHLHFELWKGGVRSGAVDPAPYLAAWSHTSAPRSIADAKPRNASLSSYRPLGDRGERYPDWVRQLRGVSGVYVIREIDGPIVYVGSSVGRLYATLTRHFQAWRRFKGFWRGQYAEGADPGLTYERDRVEVAIKRTSPSEAHDEELRTIRRLQPRDNQLGQPPDEAELEAAPF